MSLKSMDFLKLPSPIGRFRDAVKARYGVEPAELTARYYRRLGVEQAAEREQERRAIKSRAAWQAERARVRKAYQDSLGPFLSSPVKVIRRGVVERPGVTMHRILFSGPAENWVPANLYLPRGVPGRVPAIVAACGHTQQGKVAYGEMIAVLVRNGYAVICFDLIGMGERQLPHHDASPYATSTQHNIVGDKMLLAGCTLGWFMVQETMAAVSVLQTVPEIDPERIGITGSSGGGWLSVHAAALDERIKVVVPAASVSSTRHEFQPDDAEQSLFDMQRSGLDYPDLLGFLLCPRPVFIVANTSDIWKIQSTEYAFREAARCYELMGRRNGIEMQAWDRGHEYGTDQLAKGLVWFNRWLKGKPGEPVVTKVSRENAFDIRELVVCRKENVFEEGRPTPSQVFAGFVRREFRGRKDVRGFLAHLKRRVGLAPRAKWSELDRFVPGSGSGVRICFSPEEGILLPADILVPERPKGVMILVDACGRREDLDWQMRCLGEGQAVFRPDLRGWGEMSDPETWADWEGWARNLYDDRRRAVHGLARMTGRDLVFDRARDLVALIGVAERMFPRQKIAIWGRRQATLVALFAALADRRVRKLILEGGLDSFREMLETDLPLWRAEGNVRGLLRRGIDLADLRKAYSGKLIVKAPVDSRLRPLSSRR